MDARNSDFPLQLEHDNALATARDYSAGDVINTLRREWRLPALGCLIGLTLGSAYLLLTPAVYKASARILLDTSLDRYLQANKIVDQPAFDETQIGSQVYILSSESIVVPVVRSMKLGYDGEFGGRQPSHDSQKSTQIGDFVDAVKKLLGWNANADSRIDADTAVEQTAAENVLKRLSVYREDAANVISVNFESEDPNKAANIANAVADTYIASTLKSRFESTKIISEWLQDRLTELRVQAEDADRKLQEYKASHNLVQSADGVKGAEQLSALNVQLTDARVAVAEAKARLESIKENGTAKPNNLPNRAGAAESNIALNNADITKLRSEYRALDAKAAELTADSGPNHIAVVKMRKKMDELRASIRDQEQLIADSYANEYRTAKTRESELAATLAQLIGEAGATGQARVTMRELEGSADTLRNLYNSFLQKYKEINTIQTQGIPIENARIITRAAPPLYRSSKKRVLILVGSVAFGMALGAGLAVGREWAADAFRTSKMVEQATNIYCVILPNITPSSRRTIKEFVLDAPYSRFTESLRNIKALISGSQSGQGIKVIGVVSSVAKEGRTTVATNLGFLMATESGARVLLIETDLHLRPSAPAAVHGRREGLIEALVDPSRLPELVVRSKRSGLDMLMGTGSTVVPNAAELLGSCKMERLFAAARENYDYVIVEIAPIISVVDIKMIERFIDRFIFVVEWGQTRRSLVVECLSESKISRDRFLAVALNRADSAALKSIEAYKGKRFGDYYHD